VLVEFAVDFCSVDTVLEEPLKDFDAGVVAAEEPFVVEPLVDHLEDELEVVLAVLVVLQPAEGAEAIADGLEVVEHSDAEEDTLEVGHIVALLLAGEVGPGGYHVLLNGGALLEDHLVRVLQEVVLHFVGVLGSHEHAQVRVAAVVFECVFELLEELGVEVAVLENHPPACAQETADLVFDARLTHWLEVNFLFVLVPGVQVALDVHAGRCDDEDGFFTLVVDEGGVLLLLEGL